MVYARPCGLQQSKSKAFKSKLAKLCFIGWSQNIYLFIQPFGTFGHHSNIIKD